MLLVAVAAFVLYAPFWLGGRVFVAQDILNFVYPWKPVAASSEIKNLDLLDIPTLFFPIESFVNGSLKKGDIPLWDPEIFCGHPVFASGQSGLFYPPKLFLHWVFSPEVARTISMLVHTVAAACLMYAFLRLKEFEVQACMLGAVVWILNGQMVGWAEYDHIMLMATNIPLMLIGFEWGRRGKVWGWPLLAIAGALCLHSGHLQLAFYAGLILIFYALFSFASNFNRNHLLAFFGSGVLVVLLAAPTLIPFAELLRNSARQDLPFEEVLKTASSLPELLLTLFHPDLFGNPSSGFLIDRVPTHLIYAEFANYFGTFPLLLVLVVGSRRVGRLTKSELIYWYGFAVLMLLFACASPLYHLVTKVVTPLAKAIPGRSLVAFGFSSALLSCHGLDVWLKDEQDPVFRRAARFYLVLAVALWGFLVCLLTINSSGAASWIKEKGFSLKLPPGNSEPQFSQDLVEGLWQTYVFNWQLWVVLGGLAAFVFLEGRWSKKGRANLIVAVTFLELALFFWGYTPTVTREAVLPSHPSIEFLQKEPGHFRVGKYAAGQFDLLTPYGLSIATGYDSVIQKPVFEALRHTDPEKRVNVRTIGLRDFTHPFFNHAGIEFLMVGPIPAPPMPASWHQVFEQDVTIYRNPKVLERVYLADQVEVMAELPQIMERLAAPDFREGQTVILDSAVELGPGDLVGSATIARYTPDLVVVEAKASRACVLVLNDAIYEGWEVRIDGERSELLRANGVFRGVLLPAGEHKVEFRFHPGSLKRGLQMASMGLILALVWFVLAWIQRRN